MESIGNVALITIDPITAFMGGKMDSHKATEVRSQLSPLKNFAEHTGVVISAITHPAKAAGPKAIDHFIGSQAFVAAARIGHVCSEDFETNDDDGRASDWKMFAHAKHNPSKRMPSLRYRIEESFVCNDSQTGVAITAPKVIWDPTPIDMTADEVVRASNPDYAQNKRNDSRVGNWLIDLLTKNGGAMSMIDITSAAFEAGFTKAQIRYAREKCGIVVEKTTGQDSHWVWKLMLDAHSFKKFHL